MEGLRLGRRILPKGAVESTTAEQSGTQESGTLDGHKPEGT